MVIAKAPTHSLTYDGTSTYVYYASIGEGLPRHQHIYSHATICTGGSIIVRKEGKELVMTKDTQPLNLVHSEWHEIEALEDNTVFINVFAEGKN